MVIRRFSKNRGALLAAALVLFLGSEVRAQIVNVQSSLTTEAEEGLSGSISGSVDWRTGNIERLWMNLTPVGRFRRGDHLFVGIASAEVFDPFADDAADRDVKTLGHLRYRYTVNKRLIGEVFTQHEFNERRRLLTRGLVGGGPKLQLISTKETQLGLGVAYMFEYELLNEAQDEMGQPLADSGESMASHRLSSYVTGSYQFKERFQLIGTVYAQPRLTDFGDIRLLLESQLVIKLTKRLSFSSSFVVFYDSEPPLEVKGRDTRLKSSLSYSF